MAGIGSDFTHRLLADAGLRAGMRVLDIGCGAGDVTLMAAGFVGPDGAVIGIDRDAGSLASARERARVLNLAHVAFVQGTIETLAPDLGAFDAIIGRRVLMYQPDAVEAVRRLALVLRPQGLVVFHEHDAAMAPASDVPLPLHRRMRALLTRTIAREGADLRMGSSLHGVLARAGLAVEQVRAEAIVQTPETAYPFGLLIRRMMPRILACGLATQDEIDLETLDRRLDEERSAGGASFVADMMFGAWARKPG